MIWARESISLVFIAATKSVTVFNGIGYIAHVTHESPSILPKLLRVGALNRPAPQKGTGKAVNHYPDADIVSTMSQQPSLFSDRNYADFLHGLKQRIRMAQVKAALAVNRELILLYWQIGREILAKQEVEGWGTKVIDRLAQDLKREFPDVKGFASRNLKYMRSFAEAYPDEPIVQEVLAQIPWYHNIALLEKLKSREQRLWYAQEPVSHGWSRNILVLQIESGLYQRQGSAVTNFERTLPPQLSN